MKTAKWSIYLVLMATAFCFICDAPFLWAKGNEVTQEEFDVSMFIEFNSTDEDIGVQVSLDAESWKRLKIFSPDGRKILDVTSRGSLRRQGLTEWFFESSEPSLADLSLEEFKSRFPEGEYRFEGRTIEGERITGTATFTHNIPDGPSIVSPAKKGETLDLNDAVISWDPVITPAGIQIESYEVIVEGGKPPRVFDIHLPATATSVKVPAEFLEPGRKYKMEILAKEAGGNQTISSSVFKTE